MIDELRICTAAIFWNKGKEFLSIKEFTMYVSLDLRWMSVKYTDQLISILILENILEIRGNNLILKSDLSDVDVPVAYKPSVELLEKIKTYSKPDEITINLFPEMISVANSLDIKTDKFISECNNIVRKLNVDTTVAALIILRDKGADIDKFIDVAHRSLINL